MTSGGAPQGGGIYVAAGGQLTIRNSTVSGNTVADSDGPDARGGGIYVADQLELEHATVAGNNAFGGAGGGLYQAAAVGIEVSMTNTLLAENTGFACAGTPSQLETDHNLADDDSCELNGPGDLEDVDAGIAPLDDNGGPTDTHALISGSPAIDGSTNCGDPDQRGFSRSPRRVTSARTRGASGARSVTSTARRSTSTPTALERCSSGSTAAKRACSTRPAWTRGTPGSRSSRAVTTTRSMTAQTG